MPTSRLSAPAVRLRYGPSDVVLGRRADGTIIVRSPRQLGPYPRSMTDRLDHWATTAPDRVFLAQRDAGGGWSRITFAGTRALARNIAQALIDRELSAERPVAILSGNGLEHAIVGLGAMYAGIPYAPISPAYSLISSDFAKLRAILALLTPGLVLAVDGTPFRRAIEACVAGDVELVVAGKPPEGRRATLLSALWSTPAGRAVDAAHAAVGPDTIAKVLFTSGSTGVPKGVINTQRMLTSNQAMIEAAYPSLADRPPVLVDWLPWSHTFGANHNMGIVLMHGGTLYIDEGKPLPGAIEVTVRNLREVSPTVYYNVPKGYEMLLPYLRTDQDLRRSLFGQLQFLFYAGAALPQHVREELEQIALEIRGEAVPMLTSLGSTETAPSALNVTAKASGPGVIGIPNAGVELKLVPSAGKLEARLKGPLITPGYWRQPELTRSMLDDEGYYLLGDALRFADPDDPEKGFVFDGRIAEDFKLGTGTWVSAGPLRASLISHLSPWVRDAVIAGHDRGYVAAILVPDLEPCRVAAGLPPEAPVEAVLGHPAVTEPLSGKLASLAAASTGSSTRVERAILLRDQLSMDKGEVTDKGSINQRAVLAARPELIARLFAEAPDETILLADRSNR
jgi:feruloyl-CoA synthase